MISGSGLNHSFTDQRVPSILFVGFTLNASESLYLHYPLYYLLSICIYRYNRVDTYSNIHTDDALNIDNLLFPLYYMYIYVYQLDITIMSNILTNFYIHIMKFRLSFFKGSKNKRYILEFYILGFKYKY